MSFLCHYDPACCRPSNGSVVDKLEGADNTALEAKVKELYEGQGWDGENACGVKVEDNIVILELHLILGHDRAEHLREQAGHRVSQRG